MKPTDNELSERQVRLLELFSQGYRYQDVAPMLGYKSENSAKNLARTLFGKLGADNITHAVAIALRRGIIQ